MRKVFMGHSTKKTIFIVVAVLVAGLLLSYATFSRKTSNESAADIPGQIISSPDLTATPLPAGTLKETAPSPSTPAQQAPTSVNSTESAPAPPRIPTAVFTGVQGRNTSGSASIITTTEGTFIRLEDDFVSSGAAPDNRVYLGNADGFQIEISKLKSPSGGQNFRLPDNIKVTDYTYIWIHCKAFDSTYGKAEIVS